VFCAGAGDRLTGWTIWCVSLWLPRGSHRLQGDAVAGGIACAWPTLLGGRDALATVPVVSGGCAAPAEMPSPVTWRSAGASSPFGLE